MFLLVDNQLESSSGSFEDYRRLVNAKALRLGIIITAAVQVVFLWFEWLALREQFLWVQFSRALWFLPAVSLYPFLRTPSQWLLRRVDALIGIIYVAAAVFIVYVAFLHEGYQSPYIHALILMFVGVGAVTLWRLPLALSFAAAVYGVYWAPLLLGYGSIGSAVNWIGYQCFLIGTMGIILVSQQLRLQMARADFGRRCQLEDEKAQTRNLLDRVDIMRRERLTWLENLARFLRHELKNQIVAMDTSLDLVERAPPAVPPERYVKRARRSLAQMNRLVQSATEATSLEAALAVESSELLDLSGVVAEQVLLFQQANPERSFQADIEPGLEIDGQDDRVAQLLDKLLENAVQHGADGSDIRIVLRRDGESILLSVENQGDPLPPNKEALFDAFVTVGNEGQGDQNLGLGLYVAKVIVQAHAGEINACDVEEAVGARFVVTLPQAPREERGAGGGDERPVSNERGNGVEDQPPQ
jgi:signal transduction histidine kinase